LKASKICRRKFTLANSRLSSTLLLFFVASAGAGDYAVKLLCETSRARD
jgi:hypothetical protein